MHLKGIVHGQYSAESLCDQVSVRTQIAVKTAFHLYIVFLRNETNEKKRILFETRKLLLGELYCRKTRLEPEKIETQHQTASFAFSDSITSNVRALFFSPPIATVNVERDLQ